MEKIIILGSGIAGYTAAIYTARANLAPLLISGLEEGGQLTLTTEVENYPGFPEGIKGPELMDKCKEQAKKFGTKIVNSKATEVKVNKDKTIQVKTTKETYQTQALIVVTGASARWLGLPNEKQFQGKGLHTCATCDGYFYQDKEIFVVGGGDSAAEESTFLTKFAKKVTLLVRKDAMRASKIMQKKVTDNPKIETKFNTEIAEYIGDDKTLKGAKLKDNKTGEITEAKIDGIFLSIGHVPNTNFLKGVVNLDDHGFIITDEKLHTNIPGIFVAGDVQDSRYKQAITAAGTGCQAALEAERYVESNGEKK